MGFYYLIFHHEEWYETWAKNCSLKPLEKWNEDASHPVLGTIYVTLGIIFEIMYIPFLIAMTKKEVIKNSCYKLMFFLGIIDMWAIFIDAILPGIQLIQGEHFCTNPLYYYCTGSLAMGFYQAVTAVTCFLALDRFLTMLFPNAAAFLFHGKRFIIWPIITILYMFVFFIFQMGIVFNVTHQKMIFDPYRWTDLEGNPAFYDHPLIFFNSFITVFIMGPLYAVLCIVLYLKPKSIPTITKLQKVMLMQSLAICFEMFFCATFYVADSYIDLPDILTKYEHFVLICIHGDTPIVYLLLNGTLRKEVYEKIKAFMFKGAESGNRRINEAKSYFATSVYPLRYRNRVHQAPEPYLTNGMSPFPEH